MGDPPEALHQYGLELVEEPKTGEYDAIVLAVAHDEFREIGGRGLRAFGKPEGHLLVHLKSMLPRRTRTSAYDGIVLLAYHQKALKSPGAGSGPKGWLVYRGKTYRPNQASLGGAAVPQNNARSAALFPARHGQVFIRNGTFPMNRPAATLVGSAGAAPAQSQRLARG